MKVPENSRSLNALAYEEFVAESYRVLLNAGIGQVTRNRHIKGKKTGHDHQFDVVIELSLLDLAFLIIIECKHYRRRVDVSEVLEFASRLDDVSAQKGVMVTTVGYQEGAVRTAKAHGIALIVTAPQAPSWMMISGLTPHWPSPAQLREERELRKFHVTLAHYTDPAQNYGIHEFNLAWKDLVASFARQLIQHEIDQGTIVLRLSCQTCDRPLPPTQQVGGKCPKCAQRMSAERFEGGVWYRCDCGKMLHRSDLVIEVAFCECGTPTPASAFEAIRNAELDQLYSQLSVQRNQT